jgi:hypothetical protein
LSRPFLVVQLSDPHIGAEWGDGDPVARLGDTVAAELRRRSVLVVPSTYVQTRLDFGADKIRFSSEPPGFAVHTLLDGELVSHVRAVGA